MQMKMFNVYDNENQAVQDAYAMITANIHNIHINSNQDTLKTYALTSCNPKEGKTSLAISLSITLARSGWKVLLVDTDMRKPTAAKRLNETASFGLSDYLMGDVELNDAICKTNIINFTYLSCGNDHANPIGLLCSARFEELVRIVSSEYDIMLFDTPALSSVVDGALVASKVDATLLIVKMGFTKLPSLKRVKKQLEDLNANLIGVVLNRVKKRDYKKYFESYNYFFDTKQFFKKKKRKSINLPTDDQTSPNTVTMF